MFFDNFHLVKGSRSRSPVRDFGAGESIPDSGIYAVFHAERRLSQEVTLIASEAFPRCSSCGNDVHFKLVRSAPEAMRQSVLSGVRLYEIPHPADFEITDASKIVA